MCLFLILVLSYRLKQKAVGNRQKAEVYLLLAYSLWLVACGL